MAKHHPKSFLDLHPSMDSMELPRRVVILGKTGSGKSTLSSKVSKLLEIKHVEIDTIFWKPNWVMTPKPEMRLQLDEVLEPEGSWVADGNYRAFADITWSRAELIIWLDYPVWFVIWRLILRTLWRMLTREKVCGDNYETGTALFGWSTENNLILGCLKQWRNQSRDYPKLIREFGEGKMVRFEREWECEEWLRMLEGEVSKRKVIVGEQ